MASFIFLSPAQEYDDPNTKQTATITNNTRPNRFIFDLLSIKKLHGFASHFPLPFSNPDKHSWIMLHHSGLPCTLSVQPS
jgi:hypothetical protein